MSSDNAGTQNNIINDAAEKQALRFETNPSYQDEETVDLRLLFGELLSKWYILLISFIVGAALYGAYTLLFITPQYQSSAMIYVYSKSTSITSLTDLQIGTQLTSDFTIIAKTREVVEQVIEDLKMNTTYEKLVKKLSVENINSSRVLEIKVTDPVPENAAVIANDMANVLSKRIAEVTNTDEPSIVQNAVPNYKQVSPSLVKNCLIGGLVLLAIAVIIIVVIFMLDDTIKTDEDIRKYLGLNTLAMIPVNRNAISVEEAGKAQKRSEIKAAPKNANKTSSKARK